MASGFFTIGGLALIVGLVFVIWPRAVEQGMRDLIGFAKLRTATTAPVRLTGAIIAGIGVAAIAGGVASLLSPS